MLTQDQLLFLLTLLNEGKLPSELIELLTLNTDNNYLVLNNGLNDAKKIKVPLLRGFKGTYNANTNLPILTNGVGLDGDMYVVSVSGTRDFGAGTVNLLVDDIVIYLNGKYLKTNSVTGQGYLPLSGGDLTGTLNGTNASFSGNVGIGTVSPLGRLQINEYTVAEQGSQNIHGELSVFANNGDEFLFLGIKNSEYPNRGWAFNSINNEVNCDLQIKEHGASGIRMVIQSGGNVGIGTTNPTEKLEVNGNAKADSFIKDGGTSSQFLKADGSVDTNSYALASNYLPLSGGTLTGNLYEHFTIEQISVSDTLSDTQRVLQYGFAVEGTLDIPDSLNNRVWEIFVTGTQLTVQPESGSSVTFSVVHNGQSNDGVISQDHSAKLIRTGISHYNLIKY